MVKKIQNFLKDVRFELSKVSWPTWEELKSSTYVVLTLSLILILFLFVVDFILAKILFMGFILAFRAISISDLYLAITILFQTSDCISF